MDFAIPTVKSLFSLPLKMYIFIHYSEHFIIEFLRKLITNYV